MRYPKFLINAFATLGVVAFIFLACSVAEDVVNDDIVVVDDENPPIQNSIGKYQISSYGSNIDNTRTKYMDVLDTETGIVKHYVKGNQEADYFLLTTTNTAD